MIEENNVTLSSNDCDCCEKKVERKEMKGPKINLNPKDLLSGFQNKDSNKNNIKEDQNNSNENQSTNNDENIPKKEMSNREKLKMKLQTKKMMRTSRSTLKNMYDRSQK